MKFVFELLVFAGIVALVLLGIYGVAMLAVNLRNRSQVYDKGGLEE